MKVMDKAIQARPTKAALEKAAEVFRRQGGVLRTVEAIEAGVHPRTLYAMRDAGLVEQLARGLYRLAELPPLDMPDLVTVARRVPAGIVCLISALSFHDLTTEIPHFVYLALPRGAKAPRLDYPPLRVFRFGGDSYDLGVRTELVDGVEIQIFSPAKTVADCFKFRTRIGLDTALESLGMYLRGQGSVEELMGAAEVCRVAAVMRPYVEAML